MQRNLQLGTTEVEETLSIRTLGPTKCIGQGMRRLIHWEGWSAARIVWKEFSLERGPYDIFIRDVQGEA